MAKRNQFAAFFSFDGRTRRLDWWLIGIGLAVVQAALGVVLGRLLLGSWGWLQMENTQGAAWLSFALMLLFIWPQTALSMRRAHDRDNRGWLVLVSSALALTQGIAMLAAPDFMSAPMVPPFSVWDIPRHLLTSASLVIGFWLLVTLGFLDGTPGPNRYGQSPKGIGQKNYVSPAVD